MKKVSTHQAKTQLSQLIKEACSGQEIVVCRGDLPMVRLVPVSEAEFTQRPKVGTITSEEVTVLEDAFLPLSDDELKDWGL